MKYPIPLALLVCGAVACSKPKSTTVAAADTATSIAPTAGLGDTAPSPARPETVYVDRAAPPPPAAHRVAPRHEPPAARSEAPAQVPEAPVAQPAPTSPAARAQGASLASGTTIATTAIDSVHSHVNHVGDQVRVRVNADVTADDHVVIPAGSVITLTIDAIASAPERGKPGTLVLSAHDIEIHGDSYPIEAHATDIEAEMKARGVGASEVAKTAGGAAIGAVLGHIIGGKTGTFVGAVGGGAAGAAVAAKQVDRDIVVHAGAAIALQLSSAFSRTAAPPQ